MSLCIDCGINNNNKNNNDNDNNNNNNGQLVIKGLDLYFDDFKQYLNFLKFIYLAGITSPLS